MKQIVELEREYSIKQVTYNIINHIQHWQTSSHNNFILVSKKDYLLYKDNITKLYQNYPVAVTIPTKPIIVDKYNYNLVQKMNQTNIYGCSILRHADINPYSLFKQSLSYNQQQDSNQQLQQSSALYHQLQQSSALYHQLQQSSVLYHHQYQNNTSKIKKQPNNQQNHQDQQKIANQFNHQQNNQHVLRQFNESSIYNNSQIQQYKYQVNLKQQKVSHRFLNQSSSSINQSSINNDLSINNSRIYQNNSNNSNKNYNKQQKQLKLSQSQQNQKQQQSQKNQKNKGKNKNKSNKNNKISKINNKFSIEQYELLTDYEKQKFNSLNIKTYNMKKQPKKVHEEVINNIKSTSKKQLKQTKRQEQKKSIPLSKLQQFSNDLQIGDLNLISDIKFGIMLYGMKGAGKNAIAHYLSGGYLSYNKEDNVELLTPKKGVANPQNNGELIQVPRVVKLQRYKPQNINCHVINTPTYKIQTSQQPLNILSNGYFRYRLYSRIARMKFILCFNYSRLIFQSIESILTIINFIQNFNNFIQIKQEIFKSCCFLVNKVQDNHDSLNNISQSLISLVMEQNAQTKQLLSRLTEQQKKNITQFIMSMIDNDKIFIIKKCNRNQSLLRDQLVINKIHSNVKQWWTRDKHPNAKQWWTRDKHPNKPNEIKMQKICLSQRERIIESISENENNRKQLKQLIQTYNNKIKIFFGVNNDNMLQNNQLISIKEIIDRLVKDAMGHAQTHSFINIIQLAVNSYYQKLNHNNANINRNRQTIQQTLFALNQQKPISRKQQSQRKNYMIRKFNILTKIQQLLRKMKSLQFIQQSQQKQIIIQQQSIQKQIIIQQQSIQKQLALIQNYQQILISIIKQLHNLSYIGENKTHLIYHYCYLIWRVFKQTKIIIILLNNNQPIQQGDKLFMVNKDKSIFETINLYKVLKQFATQYHFTYNNKEQITVKQLHDKYVDNYDIQSNYHIKNIQLNQQFVDFFLSTQTNNKQTILKIVHLVHKYTKLTLNNITTSSIPHNKLNRLISKLIIVINYCYKLKNTQSKQLKYQLMLLLKDLGKNLGIVLSLLKQYTLSRKVFQSVHCINSACNSYKLQINQLEKYHKKQSFQTRINFIKYLKSNQRQNDARKLQQQTFQMINSIQQFNSIQNQFNDLLNLVKNYKTFFNQDYGKLDNDLVRKLYIVSNMKYQQKEEEKKYQQVNEKEENKKSQ